MNFKVPVDALAASSGAPQPGHAFDIGLTLGIVDVNALGALEDERPGVAKAREVGIGMHQRFDVAGGKIGQWRHGILVCRGSEVRAAVR